MADNVDPERLQATAAFKQLQASLGVRTPRKLAAVAQLSKAIRAAPRGRGKVRR